jgi:DNA-binding MarR family transcriptional regulator
VGGHYILVRHVYNLSVTELPTHIATELIATTSSLRRALRRQAGRIDGVSGLSDAQRELVRLVGRHPGIRVGAAANELQLASNTVSTLVGGLCASEWMTRETDPQDGRSAVLRLTPDASRRVEEWRDRRLAALSDAMHGLSQEDRDQLDAALPALHRLIKQLQEIA